MTQRIDPGSDEVSVSEDSLMLDWAELCWTGQRYVGPGGGMLDRVEVCWPGGGILSAEL